MPEVAHIAETLRPEELKKVEKPELKPEELARQIKDKLEKIRDPKLMQEITLLREALGSRDLKFDETIDPTIASSMELLGKKLKTEIPSLEAMSEKKMEEAIRIAIKIEF